MKIQKYVLFIKKNLNINMLQIKNIVKLELFQVCHYPRKYRGPAHSICNLKCNIPEQIPIVFRNGSE